MSTKASNQNPFKNKFVSDEGGTNMSFNTPVSWTASLTYYLTTVYIEQIWDTNSVQMTKNIDK